VSRTFHHGKRRIRTHGVRKDQLVRRRAARALIKLAQLQAEAEAEAEAGNTKRRRQSKDSASSATEANE
jgi:hypothetical protein